MNIAVVGAGWAGLSAAFYLHRRGHKVTVFESSPTLGGRARSLGSSPLGTGLDNGQHILLGAYRETLQLMRDLKLDTAACLHRENFSLQAADGSFSLRAPPLPAPFHLLTAVAHARGIRGAERLALLALGLRMHRRQWAVAPELTVLQWLNRNGQSDHMVQSFWRPLCVAALNTPIETASAAMLARVLRDSLAGGHKASCILIPRVGLSDIWPDHLPGDILVHRGRTIRQLAAGPCGPLIDGEKFDGIIVAANAPSARRLLAGLPSSAAGDRYLACLAAFDHVPIATITLTLERAWRDPHAMLMLTEVPARLQYGQWLFNPAVFRNGQTARESASLVIVISNARMLADHSRDDVIAGVMAQIQEQGKGLATLPKVLERTLICEKRATFAATPGLERPDNCTPWPGVWVAGDWTDTGYPAVLEGAVRSGKRAARMIAQSL